MAKKNKNSEPLDLRLIIAPEENIYFAFNKIKTSLGVKSNAEVLRFILNQIGKLPLSELGIKEEQVKTS